MSSLFIIITDRPNSPTTHTLFAKKVHFRRDFRSADLGVRVRFFSKKSENFYLGCELKTPFGANCLSQNETSILNVTKSTVSPRI
jgi:hypothetical protein